MRKAVLVFLLFLTGGLQAHSQTLEIQKLDLFFDALEENSRFMGSVALSKDGELVYSRSLGFADVENQLKNKNTTEYKIGSISKTFTATLLLKAVEEGRISLDQSLKDFFPEVRHAEKISIQQLLQHQSGIRNFTDNPQYLTWHTQQKSEKDMVQVIVAGGSDFEPGSKTSYSNSNYVLLTFILEKVFGKPYAALLQEYISVPLGLIHTYFGEPQNSKHARSNSYVFKGNWELQPETDSSIPLGAGGIVSTPEELLVFSNALFDGKLIKRERVEQMKDLQDQFGLGLVSFPFYEKQGFGHTGGIDGFSSVFAYFPDEKVSYAIASNGSRIEVNALSIALLSAAYQRDFSVPQFSSIALSQEILETYVGVYSSTEIPLKLTVSIKGQQLIAQGTGQPSFALEAEEQNVFKFDPAQLTMIFFPEENRMLLKQGGMTFQFSKE